MLYNKHRTNPQQIEVMEFAVTIVAVCRFRRLQYGRGLSEALLLGDGPTPSMTAYVGTSPKMGEPARPPLNPLVDNPKFLHPVRDLPRKRVGDEFNSVICICRTDLCCHGNKNFTFSFVFRTREVDHQAEDFHAFYCIFVVYVCQKL